MNLQDPNYLSGLILEDLKLQLTYFVEKSKRNPQKIVKIFYNNQSIIIHGKNCWRSVGAAKLAIRRFFDRYYTGKLYQTNYSKGGYYLKEFSSGNQEVIDYNKYQEINDKRIEELYKLLEFRTISD